MTALNAGLAYALRLRERPGPGRRSASGSCPSHGYVTIEIDWIMAEELNEAIQPICSTSSPRSGWDRARGRMMASQWKPPRGHADIAPSQFERIENDGYLTIDAHWIIPALLRSVPIEGRVLEPAAGRGHLSLELRRAGLDVASFDLHRYADPLVHDIGTGDIREADNARRIRLGRHQFAL